MCYVEIGTVLFVFLLVYIIVMFMAPKENTYCSTFNDEENDTFLENMRVV